jgi:hypothetical protein
LRPRRAAGWHNPCARYKQQSIGRPVVPAVSILRSRV